MKLLKCKWLSWLVSYRNLKQRFHLASLFSLTNKTTNLLRLPWFLEDEVPHWFSPCWSFNLLLTLFSPFLHPTLQSNHTAFYSVYTLSIPCFSSPLPLAVPSSCLLFKLSTIKVSLYESPIAQMVKNLPAMQEIQVWSLCQEDPLEKGIATHSSILENGKENEKRYMCIYIYITESLCCTEKLTQYCKSTILQ